MEIIVLRLCHRLPRDERISTHVALVARAFGADSLIYTGQHDSGLEESVKRICERWGGKTSSGNFSVSYEKSPRSAIRKMKKQGFAAVHLTMYGIPLQEKLKKMKANEKLLLIVGSGQVPKEIYGLADFNISVTNQPHSEVAALAIILDRLMQGKELSGFDFKGKLRIRPSEKGKEFY
ncbi:tRNA (cytidine(56)-2'-O)-methyltransferase [Candidatus Micrarchaeota archaeon]|nr:tRNA (cytidine(56)-2'-O)-methyltransferase [Candidatus Micrarchaeota archaeon]